MIDIYTVKCPECGWKRDTTTLGQVKCFHCGYHFIAREYLTKEQAGGITGKTEWQGFITAKEMLHEMDM